MRVGLAFVLVGGMGSTALAGKQKVAVLTLEVIGAMDQDNLKIAKSLSHELRTLVGQSSDFTLVGGAKDLVDEKLMNGCQGEALSCMAPIGAKLEAELLMFGKLDRTAIGFQITIKLIRVASREHLKTWSADVPIKRVVDETRAVAKLAFGKLMPNQNGTLIVKVANVDRATVYIGSDPKGLVSSGLFTTALPEGKHKLVVEAVEKGWNRHEEWITITAGDAKNVSVDLTRIKATPLDEPAGRRAPGDEMKHEITGTVSTGRSKNTGWKVLAAGGLISSAAGAGVWIWSYAKPISSYQRLLDKGQGAHDAADPSYELDSRDCGKGRQPAAGDPGRKAFEDACSARTYTKIAIPFTIAAGLVGAGALVYAVIKSEKGTEERPPTAGRRTKKRSLALTPVVSPDGAGATVRFDW